MSENKRPFEIGDMVVLDDSEVGVISSLATRRMPLIELSGGDLYHFYAHNIKTIRTPRKGGAEARAIVAMMLRETLNQRRFIHLGYRVKKIKACYEDILIAHDDIYYGLKTFEKAKAMLK